MRPASLKKQTSAGGVIYKKNDSSIQIALISVRNGQAWCLPKGIVDKGETTEETAVREVREETGLNGRIIDALGEINYWYFVKEENIKCRKKVYFYLMEYVSGDTDDHDFEVDEAGWFPLEIALEKVSYKGDRMVIEKAIEKLRTLHMKA
ncbi:MAG: hydrolase [Nitrospirae bacterium]|nr:hydrolase [Nitrospirota bacterium]